VVIGFWGGCGGEVFLVCPQTPNGSRAFLPKKRKTDKGARLPPRKGWGSKVKTKSTEPERRKGKKGDEKRIRLAETARGERGNDLMTRKEIIERRVRRYNTVQQHKDLEVKSGRLDISGKAGLKISRERKDTGSAALHHRKKTNEVGRRSRVSFQHRLRLETKPGR